MSRARRLGGRIGRIAGLVPEFVIALVVAIVVHLDAPATRRMVESRVNDLLRTTFAGDVRIEHIGRLGPNEVADVSIRARAPDGTLVLAADGVTLHFGPLALLRSLSRSEGPLIDLPEVSVRHADVDVGAGVSGELRLAQTFAPRETNTSALPSASSSSASSSRVVVRAPRIRIDHAWVHGAPGGAPAIDADLFDLAANASVDGSDVHANLDRLHVLTRGLPGALDPRGNVRGSFAMPSLNGSGVAVDASFDGEVGGLATVTTFRLVDHVFEARVDAKGDTEGLRSPELARTEAVDLHAEASGTLPEIAGKAHVTLGDATATAHVAALLESRPRFDVTVRGRGVDLAALDRTLPRSRLALDARGHVSLDDDGPHGVIEGALLPSMLDGQAVPRVDVRTHLAGPRAKAHLQIRGDVMPTEVTLDVEPRAERPDGRIATARLKSQVDDLRRVPVIGKKVQGKARVDASLRVLLPEGRVESIDARADASDIDGLDFHAGRATVTARASGSVRQPTIDARGNASALRFGNVALANAEARTRIEPSAERLRLYDTKVDVKRPNGDTFSAETRFVELDRGDVRVDAAEIRGLGEPIFADVRRHRGDLRAVVDAPNVDLVRAAALVGRADAVKAGNLALRAEGELRHGIARGTTTARLSGLAVGSIENANLSVDGSIDGRTVAFRVDGTSDNAGRLRASTDGLVLDGRADDPGAWRRAVGTVRAALDIDLDKSSSVLPAKYLSVADLRGNVSVQAMVERAADGALPTAFLHIRTAGLVVAAPSGKVEHIGGMEVVGPARWRSSDVDLGFDLRVYGRSGLTDVALRATDRHGSVISANAKMIVPYDEIARHPESARALLLRAPLRLRANVPSRRLDDLPSILGVKHAAGSIAAEIDVEGSVLEPNARLVARGRKLRLTAKAIGIDPDIDTTAVYDGHTAQLGATVASQGQELLALTSTVDADARKIMRAQMAGRPPDWRASARLVAREFPIELLPQVADLRIRGRASGSFSLTELHRNPRVQGKINLADVVLDRAEFPRGVVSLEAANGNLNGSVRLEQTDGSLDVRAETGLVWGKEIAPRIDATCPIDATLVAIGFRAAAVQPYVESVIPELDGRIDAQVGARVIPGRPGAELSGSARFHGGSLSIAALGSELSSVTANATFAPDGTVRVTDVFARSGSGEIRGSAFARFDGTHLADARAAIRIPERRAVDVSIEGIPFGQLSGAVNLQANRTAPDLTTIVVDAPKLALELPRAARLGLQSLERNDAIRVGVHRDDRRFVMLPLYPGDHGSVESAPETNPSRLAIDFRLRKVFVSRGNDLRIQLAGAPRVELEGGELKLLGAVNVENGWIDVQGKRFEVEKGIVTFDGSTPPDPTVLATAGWTAADGTRVFADFLGRVSSGHLTLRSEPPRPKNEVLALIVFGTTDGANPAPPPPGGEAQSGTSGTARAAALGLGGGLVAQGLTQALDSLTGIQAIARIDTTEANNPRPEVEIQLSPRVTLGFSHALGTPPITEPDRNFVSFDYRFQPRWSLQTVFGDRGTALVETLWQRRY